MKGCMLLADGFEDIEAIAVADILRRAGIGLDLLGLNSTMIESRSGIVVRADRRYEPGISRSYDFIVLPGGPGHERLKNTQSLLDEIAEFHRQGKVVAAICAAPTVLARAGILNDREATCYPGYEKELPRPRNGPVVVDGNIVTADSPGSAMLFALKLVSILSPGKERMLRERMLIRER